MCITRDFKDKMRPQRYLLKALHTLMLNEWCDTQQRTTFQSKVSRSLKIFVPFPQRVQVMKCSENVILTTYSSRLRFVYIMLVYVRCCVYELRFTT